MSFGKRAARIAAIVVVLCAVAMGALYAYISSGGLIARKKPSGAETMIARLMVRASVPQASKMLKNPLISDSGGQDVSAGRDLYKQKCETCHGYDGSGKTEAGGGLYPPPLDLRGPEITNATDGELFYTGAHN
jgi:mono/diheme cytochrome c family protein